MFYGKYEHNFFIHFIQNFGKLNIFSTENLEQFNGIISNRIKTNTNRKYILNELILYSVIFDKERIKKT